MGSKSFVRADCFSAILLPKLEAEGLRFFTYAVQNTWLCVVHHLIAIGCQRGRCDMSNLRSVGFISRVLALAILFFVSSVAPAQQPDAAAAQQAKQEKVAALKQSLAQNQAALKSYSWTET